MCEWMGVEKYSKMNWTCNIVPQMCSTVSAQEIVTPYSTYSRHICDDILI